MRFAYADPPYLGCCRLYKHSNHTDGCWDELDTHRRLIDNLGSNFPDGWVLSCHTPSLRHLLPLCPDDVRIGAWVKPFHVFKKGVRPAYAWEPLIYRGGRNSKHPPPLKGGKATTPKDFVIAEPDDDPDRAVVANITLRKGLTGAKPESVCRWILDLLGYVDGDELVDLFPGTAVMARVVSQYVFSLESA